MNLPDADKFLHDFQRNFQQRDKYADTIAWAIPDETAINTIAEFVGLETILEIGAGLGYWAFLLRLKGVNIIATDNKEVSWKHNANPPYIEIAHMNHKEAIKNFAGAKVLFLCWPPYDAEMAVEALELFANNKLIYIGEGYGGCNATDEFFKLLNKEWKEIKVVNIQQWFGLHDYLFMYTRIEPLKRSLDF